MLNAFASLKCSKKCLHNVQKPSGIDKVSVVSPISIPVDRSCQCFLKIEINLSNHVVSKPVIRVAY